MVKDIGLFSKLFLFKLLYDNILFSVNHFIDLILAMPADSKPVLHIAFSLFLHYTVFNR